MCVAFLLFGLYSEEMAVRIRKTGLGKKVGNDSLESLHHADNVALLRVSSDDLQ